MTIEEKDLYHQVNENYRYFLNWRARLLAGHFAALFSLGLAFGWLMEKSMTAPTPIRLRTLLMGSIPFIAFTLTLLFWGLERRNRKQYLDCMTAGRQLERPEEQRNKSVNLGVFSTMDAPEKVDDGKHRSRFSHSLILDIWFGVTAGAFFIAGLVLCCACNSLLELK